MNRPTAPLLFAMMFAAGGVSCGPQGSPTPDSAAEARVAQPSPAPEPVEVGPVALEPALQEADLRVRAEPADDASQRVATAPAPARTSPNRVSPAPGDALWRADGRPTWWADQPGWRDGRYSVCAEAFGADVRSARRAAIDAARRNASSSLGAIRDERVETAIVRAVGSEGSGGSRYVGYVRLSALRGE